ncbi:MAG TPA: ABC transporter permease [Streptosporangiaceae bacterium]
MTPLLGGLTASLRAPLRGLAHRGGTTFMILAVALVATAAAATGPTYYTAARTSILRDTVADASLAGRSVEANTTGAIPGLYDQIAPLYLGQQNAALGSRLARRKVFAKPIFALETTVPLPLYNASIPLVWRTGVCGQLRITGRCPAAPRQVVVSSRLASLNHWHAGQLIRFFGFKPLTITGIYKLPNTSKDYWFGRGTIYFPSPGENPRNLTQSGFDAMFTPRSTLEQGPADQQGTVVVDELLSGSRLTGDDVAGLKTAMTALAANPALGEQQVLISTAIPATLTSVQANWRSVAIPVVLITAQLLLLCLLLLFLTVTDATDARGTEVALVKLRGYGRLRTVAFGLSEPVLLLVLALPLGTLAGWGATALLGKVLLRPGTVIALPALAWAAAAVAAAGGIAAVVFAARRTLRRPVVDQLRRSGRQATDRGWVFDAVVATAALAGLLELAASGQIGSAKHGALGLLVPGLLGLAAAVIASRLLPVACRAAFGRTGRGGGLGLFLAIRHVARRPGGVRTTIVLATAFALASFAITAWSVGRDNQHLVAATQVGAPAVVTVSTPVGKDLGTVVAKADPSGRMAAAVDRYVSLTSGSAGLTTLAVDPQRFARVAAWRPGFISQPFVTVARELDPPAPPPTVLTGDAVRITVSVNSASPAGALLSADMTTGASPVGLGSLPSHGTKTLTGELVGCPCNLVDLDVGPPIGQAGQAAVRGSLTITALQVHGRHGWKAVPGALASAARWRPGHADTPADTISASSAGLSWKFSTSRRLDGLLESVNRPFPLPAVVSSAILNQGSAQVTGIGLDGSDLGMQVASTAAVIPGAPQDGIIIDRHYAELAAGGKFPEAVQQVWLAAGAQPVIVPRLKAAGLRVISVQTTASLAARYARQGPALASVLFLADAAAAALLAAGAAILGLYLSARRRRYEYAALSASGVRRRTLRRSVLTELALVLGFGSIIGIAAGLGSAILALRSIPEFTRPPAVPPLSYVPSAVPLAVLLGGAVALLIIAAVTASITLIAGVRLDQLREAPA